MTLDPVYVFVARLAIAALFLGASVHKVGDFARFRGVVAAYGVPERWTLGAALLIVVLEMVAGLGALAGARPGLAIGGLLLLGYAVAMGFNLKNGRHLLDCGCSPNRQAISWPLVIRNVCILPVVLIALAAPVLRPLGMLDYTSIVCGALVLGLLYAAANEIMAARSRLEEWV